MIAFLAAVSLMTAQNPEGASLGACAWQALPAQEQQAVLTAYDRNMSAGMRALSQRDAALHANIRDCISRPDLPAILTQASIASHVIQLGSSAKLFREKGLDRPRLEAAWHAAPEAARNCVFNNAAKAFRIDGPACPDQNASRAFLDRLGLSHSARTDRVASEQALIYMNAKAQQEIAARLIQAAPPAGR